MSVKKNEIPHRKRDRPTNAKREWRTKKEIDRENDAALRASVHTWWSECQMRRKLLTDEFVANVDYIGEGNWPLYVSAQALFEDFCAQAPRDLTVTFARFRSLMRDVLGVTREDTYSKSVGFKSITFYSLRMWHERNRLVWGEEIQGD